jgi:hypothetical protein
MEPPPLKPRTLECPDCGTVNDERSERCVNCKVLLDDFEYEAATAGYSGMIPTRNSAALTAYYLGIFSFIPFLGILLGIPAFFLGRAGLKAVRERPEIKGTTHAWIGIIAGGFFGFGYLLLALFLLVKA